MTEPKLCVDCEGSERVEGEWVDYGVSGAGFNMTVCPSCEGTGMSGEPVVFGDGSRMVGAVARSWRIALRDAQQNLVTPLDGSEDQ